MFSPEFSHKQIFVKMAPIKRSHLITLIIVGFLSILWVGYSWQRTSAEIKYITNSIDMARLIGQSMRAKPPQQVVKALYLTAYSAGDSKKLDEIIKLIDETELNAVVIDIKDYSGKVLFNSQLGFVKQLKLKHNRLGDLRKLIMKLHTRGIYVIARQTVFQDPELAEKKPEWAIKDKKSEIWRDRKGLAWVDPTNRRVWRYNISLAKEAISYGFDEINFDYIRFPSDGDMEDIIYTSDGRKKYETMRDFYNFLSRELANEPTWISFDFFGQTTEASGENDLTIGQRLVDAVDYADYISPMLYPSHYKIGHLGFKNPAEHPVEIVENGIKSGLPAFEGKRAKLRPWLQAFSVGDIYDGKKIRAQIDAVEKYTNAGWLLWNAANRYNKDGLKTNQELGIPAPEQVRYGASMN